MGALSLPFSNRLRPYNVPSKEEMDEIAERRKYTPDIIKLEQSQAQLLFVCDETMREHREHHLLEVDGVKDHCDAFTVDFFSMFKKKLGLETIAFPLGVRFMTAPWARIRGELYEVPTNVIPNPFCLLDTYHENGVQSIRVRVNLIVPYYRRVYGQEPSHKVRYEKIRAWMYVGIPLQWHDLIDNGYHFTPVKTFTPNKPNSSPYYHFTPQGYKD
jgi:hypothetical protein